MIRSQKWHQLLHTSVIKTNKCIYEDTKITLVTAAPITVLTNSVLSSLVPKKHF